MLDRTLVVMTAAFVLVRDVASISCEELVSFKDLGELACSDLDCLNKQTHQAPMYTYSLLCMQHPLDVAMG